MNIFSLNLPRSGGQSLQKAISILTGKPCFHSVGRDWSEIGENDSAVEVWSPVPWLEQQFPDCRLILPIREEEAWLLSCERWYDMLV